MNEQNMGADLGSEPSMPPPPNPGPTPQQANTGMAIISYLGLLVLIPLLTEAKNDPFVKFHIKQGLIVLIGLVLASFIMAIPVLGWFLGPLLWLVSIVLMVIGIMNAANGKQVELPVVGKFASNFHF
jgi:uncharacterized membrane protein